MEKKVSFNNVVNVVFSRYYIVILCTLLCGVVFFVASKFVLPKKYESYTTLYVKNSSESYNKENVNINDINASKSLAETYIEVLSSNSVMNQVIDGLGNTHKKSELVEVFGKKNGKIDIESVRKCFTMSASNKTEVLKVSARTKEPQISAEMCNIVAAFAPEFLERIVGAGSVEVIDVAVTETEPVEPNVPAYSLAGLVLGFFLSCGFIFMFDLFDNTIKDKEAIVETYKKPVLGTVQHLNVNGKKQTEKGDSRQLILNKEVPFHYIESYKSIRTNVVFSLSTNESRILAVSSPNPDEGKSTVSVNLATALAQNGEKVLLIDADMRKPVLHKMFKVSNKSGLSTTIISISPFEQAVKKDVALNLDLLSSGPMPPNPSELLASKHFHDLLVEVEKQYDYIIVDTPPLNVVSDGLVFTDLLNGILLVVRHRKTSYSEISEAVNSIELSNANLLGFVLNDVKQKGVGSYYRYKDSYYAYKA
ncbi:MAG: polysaccharide biosynthesis tyrosine autokinase [Clostridia bacterium]|nr:polysaccharide biosynthesis tyrosine autokinase [Clostridia bacterium]